MIPLKDVNPTSRKPVVNYSIIALCLLVWFYQLKNPYSLYEYALIPSKILERPYTLLTHMFLHGSWAHLIGNLWFLFVFGDNVEDRLGRLRYLNLYLYSGLGASLLQLLVTFIFGGLNVPMVGASGAISGVLGAYLYLFPNARVLALIPFFFFLYLTEVPSYFFIGLWFLVQVLNGLISLPFMGHGGVAWYAHIGGFLVGYNLVKMWKV